MENRGYAELQAEDDENAIPILPNEFPVVEWFYDLTDDFEIREVSKKQSILVKPTKADIVNSADLLGLKNTKEQYLSLKFLISAVAKEFK